MAYDPDRDWGGFIPSKLRVHIHIDRIRAAYPNIWVRLTIGIIAHELTHAYDWIVVCRMNTKIWNNMPAPEARAEKIENFILWVLLNDADYIWITAH